MSDRVGQQLGNYRLIKLLGRGSLAEVYLGMHIRLHTHVAIKVLRTPCAGSQVKRFKDTFLPLTRLAHPHIVGVFDLDVDAGVPFLVMDYAPNGTLRHRYPEGVRLPLTTIIHYIKQIATALEYGHAAKLIHGSIKPENILLGARHEILLGDFGFAILLQSIFSQKIVEHAAYMAPEQLQGNTCPASDQYALAMVIYEWLSGNHLFSGIPDQVEPQQLFIAPPLSSRVSGDVEQVISIALEREPRKRFASIQAFARAFEQASQSELEARRSSVRHLMTLSPSMAKSFIPPRPKLSLPLGSTLSVYHTSSWVLSVAWSPDSSRIASGGSDGKVRVWDVATGNELLAYDGHSGLVFTVKWSPDGIYIASAGADGTVQVWNARTGKTSCTYHGHSDFVWDVAWSPGGTSIASAGDDKTVQVWSVGYAVAAAVRLFAYDGHSKRVTALAWSPGGTSIASASDDKTVQIWSVEDVIRGQNVASIVKHALKHTGHFERVRAVAWSPGGAYIASASDDKTVQIWSVQNAIQDDGTALSGHHVFTYHGHTDWVRAVAWSPAGKYLVSGSQDQTLRVWEVGTTSRSEMFVYRAHSGGVGTVAWSSDGTRIASGSWDQTVRVWGAPATQAPSIAKRPLRSLVIT